MGISERFKAEKKTKLNPYFIELRDTIFSKLTEALGGPYGIAHITVSRRYFRIERLELADPDIVCSIFEEGNYDWSYIEPNHWWIDLIAKGEVVKVKTDLPRTLRPSGRVNLYPVKMNDPEIQIINNMLENGKIYNPLD